MLRIPLRRLLPRLFILSLLVGAGAATLTADDWACPDCYRCNYGCWLGTNEYGFPKSSLNPDGTCNPSNGNPCCEDIEIQ